MRKLPTLESLRVTSPCKVPWDRMTGDARVRHCDSCKQNVYNISDMTRAEAEELIAAKEARMCMRYFHRADGTILLRDCAVEYRPTGLIAAGAVALALSGAALWYARAHEVERLPESARVHATLGQGPPPPTVALPPPSAIAPSEPLLTQGQGIEIAPKPVYVTAGTPPPPIENDPPPPPHKKHHR